ncbi:MAG TPA: 2-oxo acid dehydrogenase subunit E2, partial [Verrucomicrobiae bacterium]|nr:2-oxo acid dehydrogenase subunit E2 [Verrucomicrobiae bacterium]
MPIELKVPAVGESITEVEIGAWLKPEGATVQKDENVVVLESEKATVELPSPATGKVSKILKEKGQTAAIDEVIGYLEQTESPAEKPAAPKEPVPAPAKEAAKPKGNGQEAARKARETKPAVMPAEQRPSTAETAEEAEEPAIKANLPATPEAPAATGREQEIVPMSPMRRTVAKNLVEAQKTAALLTTFNEIDMSAVVALRKEFQPAFQEKYGIKLGIMSFFVKAAVDALKLVPQVNAEVRGTDIIYHNFYDIGVAVGGGKGLVVPVLRSAERLSFAEIEIAINNFANRAKENKLKPDELLGGTF